MPNENKRPLLEKIEEIKARHIGERRGPSKRDVDIMYKKEALARALAAMDKTRQQNMRDWRNMKERQQAAFMAMMETQKRQKGGAPGPEGEQASQQGGGLLQASQQGQSPQVGQGPAGARAPQAPGNTYQDPRNAL